VQCDADRSTLPGYAGCCKAMTDAKTGASGSISSGIDVSLRGAGDCMPLRRRMLPLTRSLQFDFHKRIDRNTLR
jgi:hypothetical protein